MGANVSACLGEQQPTRKPAALPTTQSVARAVSTPPALQKDASRPKYFSDGDTRPVYRGAMYAFIRRSGLAWAVLCTYGMFAVWDATALQSAHFWRWDLLACRLLHVIALYFNVVLSDDLHNLDQRLGTVYDAPSTLKIEQQLHAQDWRAALAVPASYHVLLLFGIMEPSRTEMSDWLLLGVHLATCVLMCIRISPRRITPRRELFLSFVLTFVVQMVLLLVVFWRERPHHPWWLPVWAMYGSGLIAKGLERPDSETFGHHELFILGVHGGHLFLETWNRLEGWFLDGPTFLKRIAAGGGASS